MAINFAKYGVALGKPNEEVGFKKPTNSGGVGDPLGQIKNAAKGGWEQMGQAISESEAGRNPLETGVKFGEGAIGAIFSPLAPVMQPVGEGIQATGEKLSSLYSDKFNESMANIPEDVYQKQVTRPLETIRGLSTIAGTAAGMAQGQITKANLAKQRLNAPKQPFVEPIDPQVKLRSAITDATPDYESSTPTGKGKLLDRVQEGGIFKGRTVKSNAMEIEAGTELSKIPGYEPTATKLSKYQAAKSETVVRGKALETALDQEKVVVPKKEVASRVVNAINEVPNKSLLLQSADPIIKNYVRVLKNALMKEPGTLKGVLRLRKLLDDMYENARGKQAFGSDKISALDEINTVARDTLLQYIIEKAKNTAVKQSMRSQWNLFRALDILKTAAEKESGSMVGRMMQKYPLTTKVVKTVGQATGIGGAVNFLGQ